MRHIPLLAAICIAAASPVAAQQVFSLPQGCEAYVTIQKRGCSVTHLFTCAADPEGWQRRVDFDEQGMIYAGTIDAETQWIESFHPLAGETETLLEGARDPASLSTLIAEGVDTFEFQTMTQPAGYVTVFRGQDRLTGETTTIDGVTLERTEFAVTAHDASGQEVWRTSGAEFINRDWRTFLSGVRTNVTSEGEWEEDSTPMEFIFPGEAGFLSSAPRHDCGVVMSSATVPADDGAIATPIAFHRN